MRATGTGLSLRAVREFGDALRLPPFRVALALSLLLHLLLLFLSVHRGPQEESRRPAKLVQVRLLQPATKTILPPETAAPPPEEPPARERPRDPATVVPQALVEPPPEGPMTPEAPSRQLPEEPPPTPAAAEPPVPPPAEARVAIADESPAAPEGGGSSPPPTVIPSSPAGSAPSLSADPADGATATSARGPLAGAAAVATVSAGPVPGIAPANQSSPSSATSGTGLGTDGPGSQGAGPGSQAPGTGGAVDGGGVRWAAPAGPGAGGAAAVGGWSGPKEQGFGGREEIRKRIDRYKVYPRIAIRNHWEGDVEVEMHLEVDGSLTAVRLLKGSGYAVLDEATITAVRRASPFPPVSRVVTVPVAYRLVP